MSLEWRGAAVAPTDGMPEPDEWDAVTVPGRPSRFAGADAVAYETSFSDPREGDDVHAVLELRGTYAHTRVWCNGERLAEHDAYLAPLRVQLPEADEYRIVVECRAPEDHFGGLHGTAILPEERCVPGVWWAADLQTHPDPYVSAVRARPRVAVADGSVDSAAVDVTADVVTNEAIDDRLTLSFRPEGNARGGGAMDRTRVAAEPGATTVQYTVDVRDPALWWPHDRGAQPRYTVRTKLDGATASVTTGLRSVSYGDELRVNGERLPARGVALLDPTPEDVRRAAAANANLVRVRAQGVPPAVADACDEHGVLLWADLPLSGPGEFDADRGRALADHLVRSNGHHPSLAAVGVHDEPVEPYADGLGSGLLDRLRFRFRAWRASYDDAAARTVADAVDGVPTFPVMGPPGIDPDAVTLYPGWQYGAAADCAWLCDHYGVGSVVAGFGAGSLGTDGSAEDRDAVPAAFDHTVHDDAHLGGDAATSQATQARVVQAVAEQLRRRGSDVTILDSLRDAADAGMGVLRSNGSEKPAYGTLTDSYQPTQAVLTDPTPGESDVCVVHDRPTETAITVEWDHNGERTQEEQTIEAFGRVTVGSVTLAEGDELTLAVAVGENVVKNEYAIGHNI
ncbi:hydrolase [Halomicroarcula limicola]|uniref:Hydrolase n=1 Tax=Haloarcula limicola TaxID=1429915 RepID=A0A8J7Y7U1_9EURY|nr:hydrolase [Halomicroarcula limicola]MBV0923641.1 hydrolase [Halomicroarcula limicola]